MCGSSTNFQLASGRQGRGESNLRRGGGGVCVRCRKIVCAAGCTKVTLALYSSLAMLFERKQDITCLSRDRTFDVLAMQRLKLAFFATARYEDVAQLLCYHPRRLSPHRTLHFGHAAFAAGGLIPREVDSLERRTVVLSLLSVAAQDFRHDSRRVFPSLSGPSSAVSSNFQQLFVLLIECTLLIS